MILTGTVSVVPDSRELTYGYTYTVWLISTQRISENTEYMYIIEKNSQISWLKCNFDEKTDQVSFNHCLKGLVWVTQPRIWYLVVFMYKLCMCYVGMVVFNFNWSISSVSFKCHKIDRVQTENMDRIWPDLNRSSVELKTDLNRTFLCWENSPFSTDFKDVFNFLLR